MSQSKPKISEIDFSAAGWERRAPLPITNLPVNALTGDADPTRELRNLIDQLQTAAREARAEARQAELTREEMAIALERTQRQNEELRSHFVEITSLIRERDLAAQEAERQTRAVADAQTRLAAADRERSEARRQCEEISRQRDDAIRQRDEAKRQREEAQRQKDELHRKAAAVEEQSREQGRKAGEMQKQLLPIRQARDAAQAQSLELSSKLARAEDELADLQYQIEKLSTDADPEKLKQLQAERETFLENGTRLEAEREQLLQQLAEARIEAEAALDAGNSHAAALEQMRLENAGLQRELEATQQMLQEVRQELEQNRAELEAARSSLIAERDAAVASSSSAIEDLRRENETIRQERATTDIRAQILTREVMDLRHQLEARATEMEQVRAAAEATTLRMTETKAQFDVLAADKDAAARGREEAITSLHAAQKQIDRLIRDRDLTKQQATENALGMEAQIEALRAQLNLYEAATGDGSAQEINAMADLLATRDFEKRELAERLESQRVETIDLATRLQAAQEQIKTLSANIAELRLQTRASLAAASVSTNRSKETAASPAPANSGATPGAEAQAEGEIFPVAEALDAVRAMRRGLATFAKDTRELSHLQEIQRMGHVLAERARSLNLIAVHRIVSAFAGLAGELYHYPEQVNQSTLRTLSQTIEFLAAMFKLKDLRSIKDPATAVVYAVDDEPDNAECIRMALETAMLKSRISHDPFKAINELAETSCDLIFLDINLPGMDGFELCSEIRQLSRHRTTPIIFLTGLASSEHRAQSSLCGGNDFIGKPFILCELTVKALTLVLKSQLHIA